jgi:hypothetical protein
VVGFARIRRAEGAAPSHGGLGIGNCPGRVVEGQKEEAKRKKAHRLSGLNTGEVNQ